MNLRRLLAISRKEVLQVLRDSRSLLIVLLMPLMLMTTLGYGVNLDTKHIRVFALDREGSQASQDLLKRFQSSDYFDLAATVTDYRALGAALDDGRCQLAIVIPFDFSARLHDGRPVYIQALVDGSDNNTAELAIGYAQGVLASYGAVVQAEYLRKSNAPSVNPALSVEARTWFNEDLESKNFIVPGVAAIVMAVVGVLLTSLTVAREWERGTMEQLISTPVTVARNHHRQAAALLRARHVRHRHMRGDRRLLVPGPVSRFADRAVRPAREFTWSRFSGLDSGSPSPPRISSPRARLAW